MLRLAARLTVLICVVAAPATAHAGRAELIGDPGDEREDPTEKFKYTALAGEQNRVQITFNSDHSVVISDSVTVSLGRGCTRQVPGDPKRARCKGPGGAQIFDPEALLGDGNDTGTGTEVAFDGGSGDDRLTGSNLRGGPGSDVLEGEGALRGGPGNDQITGSGSGGVTVDESDANNGSDTIRGTTDPRDSISYRGRRAGVKVDLAGDRDDGAPGENDLVGADVDYIDGGQGDDMLVGNEAANKITGHGGSDSLVGAGGDDFLWANEFGDAGRARTRDHLDGGAGDDVLDGSRGANRMLLGPGHDTATGQGGGDTISARDGSADSAQCGAGADGARLDELDFAGRSCERVRRRGTAAAVPVKVVSFGVDIGCPVDGPAVCRGVVSIRYRGKLRSRRRFGPIRKGRVRYVFFSKGLDRYENKVVAVIVRSKDRRGRSRTITRRGLVTRNG